MLILRFALGNNRVEQLFGEGMHALTARIDPLLHFTHVTGDDAKVTRRVVVTDCIKIVELRCVDHLVFTARRAGKLAVG